MFISYDGLVFECLRLDDWSRHNVIDEGGNYQHTHHEIAGAAIINPDLMAPDKFPLPSSLKGKSAPGKLKSKPKSPKLAPSDPRVYPGGGVGATGQTITAGETSQSNSAISNRTALDAINAALAKADAVNGRVDGAAEAEGQRINPLAGRPLLVPGVARPTGNIPVNADAALTDFIVRQRLAVPRRKLFVWMHSSLGLDTPRLLLESPLGSAVTDCRVGPQFDVTWFDVIGGNLSLVIGFKITTDVNNWVPPGTSPGDGTGQPAMLGNSWSFTVTHDQDYFATHTVEGMATYRRDVLEAKGLNTADLRTEFMHPIPIGFKRDAVEVKQIGDGCTIIYQFKDVEQPMHFVGGLGVNDKSSRLVKPFASRIEIVEEQEHSQPLNNRSWDPGLGDFWGQIVEAVRGRQ